MKGKMYKKYTFGHGAVGFFFARPDVYIVTCSKHNCVLITVIYRHFPRCALDIIEVNN